AELQQGDEVLAVKGAGAVVPVHEVVQVHGQDVGEHSLLGIPLAEELAAIGHGGQRRLHVRHGPAHPVAHHAGGAYGGADGEGAEDLVELAVLLRGLEHVLHQGLPASQLGVGIDVGPQVLQNVLGAVLADGQAAGGQNVRHVAGANLRVQPGQAGVVVLVGVVLGVVN